MAAALFADGGSATVLLGHRHPMAHSIARPALVATASCFLPDTLGAMGYDVIETGLRLVLDKRLPDFLRGRLKPLIEGFVEEHGLRFEPVGPRFLSVFLGQG